MKIDSKFTLRTIAGETIIVSQGTIGADLTKIISLNSSAAFIFEQVGNKEFSVDDIKNIITENYEIDEATAAKDAAAWIESLRKCNVVTD